MPRKSSEIIPPSPPIVALIPSWLRSMRAQNNSPATVSTRSTSILAFCRWLNHGGNPEDCRTTIAEVSQEICQEWVASMVGKLSDNTVSTRYRGVQAFLRWCVGDGELDDSPMRNMKSVKIAETETPILTDAEVSQLLATCERGKSFADHRDHAIIRVLLSTGMRLSELVALELDDINLDSGAIRVRRGKGGRFRIAAIGRKTSAVLDKYIRVRTSRPQYHDPHLWLSLRGPMHKSTIQKMLQDRARAAGIDRNLHPHMFRHGFAHSYLAAGGSEVNLLAIAGWSNLEMVHKRYGRVLRNEDAINEHHRLGLDDKR